MCAIVGVVASGYQQELKLVLSKLNRMDAKIDHLFRKLNVVLNKTSSTGNSGSVDIPAVPDGITVPADTVKNLSAAASMVVRDEAVRNKMASISHSASVAVQVCVQMFICCTSNSIQ